MFESIVKTKWYSVSTIALSSNNTSGWSESRNILINKLFVDWYLAITILSTPAPFPKSIILE